MVLLADPRNPESRSRVQVHYKHRREVDKYFDLAPPQRDLLPGCVRSLLRHSPRARVTYDQRTKEVLAKIVKARVADLHIHMPNSPVDCRLSVNLEMDWPGPVEELETGGGGNAPRQKDRLSYAQGNIQVDLTQVSMAGSGVSAFPCHTCFLAGDRVANEIRHHAERTTSLRSSSALALSWSRGGG